VTATDSEFEWRSLEPGTQIVVEDGPLYGVRGTVLGVDEDDRVIVSVLLLRGVMAFAIDAAAVRIEGQMPPAALRAH
jgi:transcription antitermination factor NusG